MISRYLLILTILSIVTSLNIPLLPMVPRCMIVFTSDPDQTLKLQVEFPFIENQSQAQYFQISLLDTETKRTQYQTVNNGKFKKEYELDLNVLYRVCFKAVISRSVQSLSIVYDAQIQHDNMISPRDFRVPEKLLKDQNLKQTYEILQQMTQKLQNYKLSTTNKRQFQSESYQTFVEKNSRISNISYLQIGAILIVGVYQFFTIRKFLINKQSM